MYRDRSLMPKEAVRLAVLGELVCGGELVYADLAQRVRHFLARLVGPSLDLLGPSIELLRVEGLATTVAGEAGSDQSTLRITSNGRAEFDRLMTAAVRAPSADGMTRLVIALKMRFLDLVDRETALAIVDALEALYEGEVARLGDLRAHYGQDAGHFAGWLDQDIAGAEAGLAWFSDLARRLEMPRG